MGVLERHVEEEWPRLIVRFDQPCCLPGVHKGAIDTVGCIGSVIRDPTRIIKIGDRQPAGVFSLAASSVVRARTAQEAKA